ncbi:MAG: malonyl-CoA O-methyltransferase [Halieaceae bacterium]|jgi:malonyl-CoA O-methyltransferase
MNSLSLPIRAGSTGQPLFCEHLSCAKQSRQTLVLIHGWGFDRNVWRGCIPALRQWANLVLVDLPGCGSSPAGDYNLDILLPTLADSLPAHAVWVGWSLGGTVATAFAQRYPERIDALVCIATNPHFLASDNWPNAMDVQQFEEFGALLETDANRGLQRFDALQCGARNAARAGRRQLRALFKGQLSRAQSTLTTLRDGLQLLADSDNRVALTELRIPCLHLLGESDLLVPVSVQDSLVRLVPEHRVEVCVDGSHLLPLTHSSWLCEVLAGFLGHSGSLASIDTGSQLNKSRIARSFSRAAVTYDRSAQLQERVGEILIERCAGSPQSHPVESLVDLGSGTGALMPALCSHYPGAQYLAVDIAEGMLRYARSRGRAGDAWICADAEDLPLASASIDLVFSSLAIQWCENYPALFGEIFRVLKPGGRFVFSSLGPETLHELRRAWSQVDDYTHVNTFHDASILQAAIAGSGFASQEVESIQLTLNYPELRQLTGELKGIGAHNLNPGAPSGLTSPARIRKFRAAYEEQRVNGLIPATYQVLIGQIFKAELMV